MARLTARVVVAISLLCLGIIILGAALGIDPTVKPEAKSLKAAPTVTPAPTSATPPSPTNIPPTDPRVTALKNRFEFVFGTVTRTNNMIQALWPPLVGVLILVLAILLITRAIEEWQGDRLEFDPLKNGTGAAELNDALPGLEALVREKLIWHVKQLKYAIDGYASSLAQGALFPSQTPWPQDAENKATLEKVIDALGDDSPKYTKSLLSLWRYLFPARGLRVRMTLQGDSDSARPIGITFEFLDLRNQENSIAYTMYEEKAIQPAPYPWMSCSKDFPEEKQATKAEPPPQPYPPKGTESWLLKVAAALEQASLYEDAVTYYEKALAEQKNDPNIPRALAACQNRLSRRVAATALFAAAARLEESKLFEAAVKGYAQIFQKPRDVQFARGRWQVALDLRSGVKGEALNQLAEKYLAIADLHDEALGLLRRAMEQGYTASRQTFERIQREQADALVQASQCLLENAQWLAADKYLTQALTNVPDHPKALQLQSQLKASQPAQENKEALAAYEVGKLYLAQGRQTKATEYFVQALQQQPDYKDAQNTLTDVLKETNSLATRFAALLDNALVWLAIELFRQQTNRYVNSGDVGQFRKAQYHNFYGGYLLAYYEHLPSFSFFAAQAEAEFFDARAANETWWFPDKQLGDLYFQRGLNEPDGGAARRMLRESVAWYDRALKKFDVRPNATRRRLSDPAQLRTQSNRLVARLLCCPGPEERNGLWNEIQTIENEIRGERQRLQDIALLEQDYNLVYLYLAMWYAVVAYRLDTVGDGCGSPAPKRAIHLARFYLACAVFLEAGRMRDSRLNLFLQRLFTDEESSDLAEEIEFKKEEVREISPVRRIYWEDVYAVLKTVMPAFPIIL